MDLQKRRKLIEEGVLVDDSPKSPKTEESRLVSKAEMMDCLLAKDYGTTIQNGPTVVGNALPDVTEKTDAGEKENLDKDTLEGNVGVTMDNLGVTMDNMGATVDNVGVTPHNVEVSMGNLNGNASMIVDNRGDQGGGSDVNANTDAEYCELEDGDETELYNKEKMNEKQDDKKKIGKNDFVFSVMTSFH